MTQTTPVSREEAEQRLARAAITAGVEAGAEEAAFLPARLRRKAVAEHVLGHLKVCGFALVKVGTPRQSQRVNTEHGRRLLEAARTSWLFGRGPLTLQRPPGYESGVGPIETNQEVQVARDVDPEMAALICWAVNYLPKLLDRYEDLP
jgi:hypothetical protein